MLALTRRARESITIGNDVKITIIRVAGNQVRIGIEAPRNVAVCREELYKAIRAKQASALKHLAVAAQARGDPRSASL